MSESKMNICSVLEIARVCHEANRAYCAQIGDASQKPWDEAESWQRESAVSGVRYALANPTAPASAQHDVWRQFKEESGWVYGETKDSAAKRQRRKDALFKAVVAALTTA